MLKRSMMFFASLVIAISATDAFAVASVKKFGGVGTTASAVKTTGVTPKQSTGSKSGAAIQAKVAKTPTAKIVAATASTERIPTIATVKPVNVAKTKQDLANITGGGPTPGPVNANIEVDDSAEGYVTGLTVTKEDGTTLLTTQKTTRIALEIKNDDYQGTENGEIWLVE